MEQEKELKRDEYADIEKRNQNIDILFERLDNLIDGLNNNVGIYHGFTQKETESIVPDLRSLAEKIETLKEKLNEIKTKE